MTSIWPFILLGAFLVASTVILAPRLGAASMIALNEWILFIAFSIGQD
jgi:uncharacterized membrane protein YdcZ (DUF606 family)